MNRSARFAAVALLWISVSTLLAADWPGFRGSNGGVSDDKNLPAELTETNVLWKVKIPGVGTSSPIVTGDKVLLTCYSGYGTTISKGFGFGGKGGGGKGGKGGQGGQGGKGGGPAAGDQKDLRLHLVCFDRKDGKILWQKDVEPKLPEYDFTGFLREHGYASSTPVTDGQNVFVFFGKTGVLAFDLDGKQLWQTDVGSKTDKWGSASSPVLTKNLVIVNAAIESGALVALDKKSGKEVWRVKDIAKCWTSPLIVDVADRRVTRQEIVLSLPGKIRAFDVENGKDLWHCQGIGAGSYGYTASTPVAKDGIVYVIGGGGPSSPATSLAVRAGGEGDVSESHVVWKQKVGTNTCSPVLSGAQLCWVNGSAYCLDAKDGKIVYQERLYNGRSEYVSAVADADKIFALTRFDGLYILAAGKEFKKLGHFDFGEDTSIFNASPAVSDARLYIRSNKYLYCFGKKGPDRDRPTSR